MSVTERQRAALSNRSPKNAQRFAPDPTWKAQQAFIRATRRGSKKHSSMEKKLELLDSATAAIPRPPAVDPISIERAKNRQFRAQLIHAQKSSTDGSKQVVDAPSPKPEGIPE